jgi:hypothetical protein
MKRLPTTELLKLVTDELLAHGAFSNLDGNNRPNAEIAALAVINMVGRELERLSEAKRRALAIADERSKENVALRNMNAVLREEIERLRVRLAECDHRR